MSNGYEAKELPHMLRTMGKASAATPDDVATFEAAAAATERLFPNCPKIAFVGGDGAHPMGNMLMSLLADIEEMQENLRNMAWQLGDIRLSNGLPEVRKP